LGYTYECPEGFVFNKPETDAYLAGDKAIKIIEIEVFKILLE
jgi:hypothetical protein